MDRRSFLRMTVGGLAAGAAVRTWPFRVYSFPQKVYGGPAEWWGYGLTPAQINSADFGLALSRWRIDYAYVFTMKPSEIMDTHLNRQLDHISNTLSTSTPLWKY